MGGDVCILFNFEQTIVFVDSTGIVAVQMIQGRAWQKHTCAPTRHHFSRSDKL